MIYLVGHRQNPRKTWSREAAVDPTDPNSAGQRLWQMSGIPMDEYLQRFVRLNVMESFFFPEPGDQVVLLGRSTAKAMAMDFPDYNGGWFETIYKTVSVDADGRARYAYFTLIPHPSGRCLLYNDPVNVERVRDLFQRLVEHSKRKEKDEEQPHRHRSLRSS